MKREWFGACLTCADTGEQGNGAACTQCKAKDRRARGFTVARFLVAWREERSRKMGEEVPAVRRRRRRRTDHLPFTQEMAAEALGVPPRSYTNWEQGQRVPRGLTLKAVLDYVRKDVGVSDE
jgi:DNA-binding XRE family transcriptional regulator